MSETFIYQDKPLSYWIARIVSEEPAERHEAIQAIDSFSEPDAEVEPILTAFRELIQNEGLSPYGISSAEFVERLLALSIMHSHEYHSYWQEDRRETDTFIDDWVAKHGKAPEKFGKLLRRLFIRTERKQRDNPFDFGSQVWINLFIQKLDKELLPASQTLRWMLHQRNDGNNIQWTALDSIFRMKTLGEPFFDEIIDIARTDSCCLNNWAWKIGGIISESPEKIRRLLQLTDDPDPQMSIFAISALGSCGTAAERLVPGCEERLLQISAGAFDLLYGNNSLPIEDRKNRNDAEKCFTISTISLGNVGRSEKTLNHFLKMLDAELPDKPLIGSLSENSKEFDWELHYAPRHLIWGSTISALEYFHSYLEVIVPKLIPLLTEFREFDCDRQQYRRVLDALAVYAQAGPDEIQNENQRIDFLSKEFNYVFRNRTAPYFQGLPELLGSLLWYQPQYEWEEQTPSIIDIVAEMLGRFGAVAASQLPVLEKAKVYYLETQGNDYFDEENWEDEPALLACIRRIQNDC